MNTFDALNLLALNAAKNPDSESNHRFVMRWYSKTFHTPLHVVMSQIPVEDVWLAFFEERYQNMDPEQLDEFIAQALETPEERRERLSEEEKDRAAKIADAEFVRKTEEMAAKKSEPPPLPETTPPPPVIEPDVDITFVEVPPEEMEALLDAPKQSSNPASFR